MGDRKGFQKLLAGWLATAVVVAPAHGCAEGWEVEANLVFAGGSEITRPTPFTFQGQTFEGPYRTCDPALIAPLPLFPNAPDSVRCNRAQAYDVEYSLQERSLQTGILGLSLRHRVNSALAENHLYLGVGVLGGLGARQQRLFRTSLTGRVSFDRPLEPDATRSVSGDPASTQGVSDGVGFMAYVHLELRYELELGGTGLETNHLEPFLAAGVGFLPVLPSGDGAGLGGAPGFHARAGVRLRRRPARDLTLSLIYVRALPDTSRLVAAHLDWLGLGLGMVFGGR